MSKQSVQSQNRKLVREANHKIYVGIATYLMGPKWIRQSDGNKNGGYQIDSMSKNTADDVIRVYNKQSNSSMAIYFGHSIRISVKVSSISHHNCESGFYHYFDNSDYHIPDDMDDYVYITTTFLRELCKHIMCLSFAPEHYPSFLTGIDLSIDDYIPEKLKDIATYDDIALYNYSYEDKDIINHMISVFKSKKFKRGRGV